MTGRNLLAGFAVALPLIIVSLPKAAQGQQVAVEAPFHSVSHSFYEQIGVRWGIRGNGWFFNFGGPPPAPPFGGFDPNAGANFGFAGPSGFFLLTAGQGSSTTLSGAAPSVVVPNGGVGFFSDTIQRPFVTGLVPVVGAPMGGPSVLDERLHRLRSEGPAAEGSSAQRSAAPPASDSSAEHGDLSVTEIKARKEGEKVVRQSTARAEVEALLQRAHGSEDAGKPGLAKVYLQMAARRASEPLRSEILKRVESLDAAAK
jgi:hypothetical protein